MKKRITTIILIISILLGSMSYLFADIPSVRYSYKIVSAQTLSDLESLINDNAKQQWASKSWYVEGGICFDGKEYSVIMYKER